MNQIAQCDWLPERARWSHLAHSGPRCIPQEKLHRKPYNKSFTDQVCSVKMAVCWPRSFFASLWTSTSSRSINTQKKSSANIQPSWPHTWSITHIYYSTNCNTIQIWSWCSRYRSSVGNRYPAIYVASYVLNVTTVPFEIKFTSPFLLQYKDLGCFVINLLNNKTIILLNLAEYRLILADSAYDLVG